MEMLKLQLRTEMRGHFTGLMKPTEWKSGMDLSTMALSWTLAPPLLSTHACAILTSHTVWYEMAGVCIAFM